MCDYNTYEFENFPIDIFSQNNKHKIFPNIDILKIVQDKYTQKIHVDNNINVPTFNIINSYQDIVNFINIHKYPVFLKNRKGSFDGRGNHLIKDENDLNKFTNIKSDIYIIEKYVDFDKEVSIIEL